MFFSYDIFEGLGAGGREGLGDVVNLVLLLDEGLVVFLNFLDESRCADGTLPFFEVNGLNQKKTKIMCFFESIWRERENP